MHRQFFDLIDRHRNQLSELLAVRADMVIAGLDLSKSNEDLHSDLFADTAVFSNYIDQCRVKKKADFLAGGYNELRVMYERSELFDSSDQRNMNHPDEPRRLHLGLDIWGPVGTPVFAPLAGTIHSVAFNDRFGDYGATIIIEHQLETISFYSLYGHLSLRDIENRKAGEFVESGELMAHFGNPEENGHWPPHLHFQLILNIGTNMGDYPGVCKESEREMYLQNCPDPEPILRLSRFMTDAASSGL